MKVSQFKTATIDIDRASEFTGDDVDQFSSLVDLDSIYENLLVILPDLTSATVSIYVQETKEIDEVPVVLHILDDDATGSFLHATTAGTGAIACIFRIGGVQHIRVRANANQAADRSIKVRGF